MRRTNTPRCWLHTHTGRTHTLHRTSRVEPPYGTARTWYPSEPHSERWQTCGQSNQQTCMGSHPWTLAHTPSWSFACPPAGKIGRDKREARMYMFRKPACVCLPGIRQTFSSNDQGLTRADQGYFTHCLPLLFFFFLYFVPS